MTHLRQIMLEELRRRNYAHNHSQCHQQLKPKCVDSNGNLANDQDGLIQIQIP